MHPTRGYEAAIKPTPCLPIDTVGKLEEGLGEPEPRLDELDPRGAESAPSLHAAVLDIFWGSKHSVLPHATQQLKTNNQTKEREKKKNIQTR